MRIGYPYSVQCSTRGEKLYRTLKHYNQILGSYPSRAQCETAYFAHKRFIKEKEKVKV